MESWCLSIGLSRTVPAVELAQQNAEAKYYLLEKDIIGCLGKSGLRLFERANVFSH